jgi:hypothetical protein
MYPPEEMFHPESVSFLHFLPQGKRCAQGLFGVLPGSQCYLFVSLQEWLWGELISIPTSYWKINLVRCLPAFGCLGPDCVACVLYTFAVFQLCNYA